MKENISPLLFCRFCKCTIDNESIRWYQYACLYYEDKREEANTEKKGV